MKEPAPPPLLSVSQLAIEVGDRVLCPAFDLHVHSGDLVEIRGTNGSGKTTLLRYLIGTKRSVTAKIQRFEEKFVYVGQQLGLTSSLTTLENLRWFAGINDSRTSDADLKEVLAKVGLHGEDNKPVGALSAGQARRCSLAKLVISDAKLWLLDEPLTSLDDAAAAWLSETIEGHRAGGGAAVVATHLSLGLQNTASISLDES